MCSSRKPQDGGGGRLRLSRGCRRLVSVHPYYGAHSMEQFVDYVIVNATFQDDQRMPCPLAVVVSAGVGRSLWFGGRCRCGRRTACPGCRSWHRHPQWNPGSYLRALAQARSVLWSPACHRLTGRVVRYRIRRMGIALRRLRFPRCQERPRPLQPSCRAPLRVGRMSSGRLCRMALKHSRQRAA